MKLTDTVKVYTHTQEVSKTPENMKFVGVLFDSDFFDEINLCECFNKFGVKMNCQTAECHQKEHNTVQGFNFYDGKIWQTLILKNSIKFEENNDGLYEIDTEKQKLIINEFTKRKQISETIYKSKNFTFFVPNTIKNPFIAYTYEKINEKENN